MRNVFALIAVVCFLVALLKYTDWIFGMANAQSFLAGGFLALAISWLYAEVPRPTKKPAQEQPTKPPNPNDPESHIGMR